MCDGGWYGFVSGGDFVADAGVSLNPRTELGGEILWVPETLTTGDQIRVTFATTDTTSFNNPAPDVITLLTGPGSTFTLPVQKG